jgi:hypothetical protein
MVHHGFPDQPNILVATERTPTTVAAVMDQAVAATGEIGPGARIWVVYEPRPSSGAAAFASAAKAQ